MKRNTGLAALLIAFGALILFNKLGFHLGDFIGSVMGYVIPLIMVGLGYLGIKNDKKIGWVIAGIGIIILVSKLAGWIIILLAIGLIGYGFSMLKGRTA
ncbi:MULTISPECIES: LiaF transmembrane domain-containing protein [Paenibacillus]|uniref:LiaF transmembrane domain-containing protein n=1 Tax=Paenibacillus TaxID=44249 RepID=UPI00070A27BE|nr:MULTISPECIES: hypothetical protein [Paenibacillus]KRE91136.1 hypothetical protein ASG89_34405 [Paenibacillus sp. Soil766]NQX62422.1 hypothetical protein [Paenibacillus qinlingensis]